jgi:hypothetical protein
MKSFNGRCAPAPHMWMTAEEVVNCSLRKLSSKQVIVIPGMGYGIVGRLAQMPVLQPLMQWATRVPRLAPCAEQVLAGCPAPVLEVVKVLEAPPPVQFANGPNTTASCNDESSYRTGDGVEVAIGDCATALR